METAPSRRRARPPWWMWAVAVPFFSYIGLICTAHLLGPEDFATFRDESSAWRLTRVEPGSAASRCGLRAGDLVVAWNGDTHLYTALWSARAGRADTIEFERDGEERACTLVLREKSWRSWTTRGGLNRLLSLLLSAAWLLLAAFVAWSRPDDTSARWGALLMAQMSVVLLRFGDLGNPTGGSQFLVEPFWGLAGLAAVATGGTINSVVFTFCALFPQRLTRRRFVFLLFWLPAAVQLPAVAAFQYGLPGPPLTPLLLLRTACLLLAPVVLVLNYRRLTDLNHRRRVRLLVLGVGIYLVAYLPFLVIVWTMPRLSPAFLPLATAYANSYAPVFRKLVMLASPVCVAFAILRHRLFDIQVMVRQGLQYAAARHLLLAAAPLFAGILALDLVLHGDQPLRQVLADRGWLYLLLGALGLVAHRSRRSWLLALDRRFFRERYDAQAILRGVVEEARREQPVADLAERVVQQIESALHPEVVAILSREATEAQFGVLAQRPASAATPPLHAESKLVAMLRLLQKPLGIPLTGASTDWLRRQLPREETDYLSGSRLEWLFPISLGTGPTEGLLALGPKRSEEPYSEEDQQLLGTIAASLALVLERPPAHVTTEAAADANAPTDADLSPPELVLARRYSLLRPLGRGGMGLVYEAHDNQLDRRVAVKLMHRELVESPEATARFRREAKAAAGLSHPNIVTVHDFGIDAEQGAYLVMELLQGVALREELRRVGRFPADRALRVLGGVVAGVEAAHDGGLVHRDLKPENVFLVRAKDGEIPKVLDFGIARTLDGARTATVGLTTPGHLIGTPRYMSPEQLHGGTPSPAWDIWALAIVAYELIAGQYPFPTESAEEWQRAIGSGQVRPLREPRPETAAGIEALFRRALAPEPAGRPPSVRQLLDELGRVLRAEGP